VYYLVCSWAYGPTVDELSKVITEENGSKEEDSTELKNGNPLFDDKVSDSSKEKELTEFKNGLKEEELTKD
jgi:peptide/histidine transporter 3/4